MDDVGECYGKIQVTAWTTLWLQNVTRRKPNPHPLSKQGVANSLIMLMCLKVVSKTKSSSVTERLRDALSPKNVAKSLKIVQGHLHRWSRRVWRLTSHPL